MIDHFVNPYPNNNINVYDYRHGQEQPEVKQAAKRIRNYIHHQYIMSNASTCASNLAQRFPVLETLSPELQREASVLLMNQYLKAIPYLSSKYLSTDEQYSVAMECLLLEFGAGENVNIKDSGLGRGVFIMKQGCALITRGNMSWRREKYTLLSTGMAFGRGKVLVSDDHPASEGTLQFLTFSKVVFIPRKAILAALEKNEKAWKCSARWIFIRTLLRDKHVKQGGSNP
jgi:hypothetical protein